MGGTLEEALEWWPEEVMSDRPMTSSDVRAVLLVPAEGDPLKLLADNPCGGRPPAAVEWDITRLESYFSRPAGGWCWLPGSTMVPGYPPHRRHALVLAWDGELVAEGIDRASRRSPGHHGWVVEWQVRGLLTGEFLQPGRSLTALGAVVVLDADGREALDAE